MKGEIKASQILMSLLIFSGLAFGVSQFYLGTATPYVAAKTQLYNNISYFNQADYINTQISSVWSSLNQISPYNPATWLNIIPIVLNLFNVFVAIPGTMHTLIVYAVHNVLFMPEYAAYIVEIAFLIILVVAAISAVNQREI
jgi:hypothetical protein